MKLIKDQTIMNTIKTSLFAIALFTGSIIYGNSAPHIEGDPGSISKEVSKMLAKHDLELNTALNAKFTFTVNKHNEIVVIEVDSKDERLEYYVKTRLNYKKLKTEAIPDKIYFLSLKVEKSR